MPPTLGNGKVCYLEIPATDVRRSAAFYQAVVGWQSRRRGDGTVAFDDGVGEVSGTWVTGRPPSATPGVWSTSWSIVWPQLSPRQSNTAERSCNLSERILPRSPRGFAIPLGTSSASIKSRPVRHPRPSDRVPAYQSTSGGQTWTCTA